MQSIKEKLKTLLTTDGQLGFRPHLIIMSAALIPLLVFFQYASGNLRRSLMSEQVEKLENIHHSVTKYLEREIIDTSQQVLQELLSGNLSADKPEIIENIYVFDQDYFPLSGSESAPVGIRLKLQELVFKDSLEFREDVLRDGSSRIICYARLNTGYAFWIFSYDALKDVLRFLLPETVSMQLFSERFQRAFSTEEYQRSGIVLIDPLTELMTTKISGTGVFDDKLHFYGSIHFSELFLFLSVYESPEENALYVNAMRRSGILIVLLSTLLTFFLAFSIRNQLYRWLEKALMNSKFHGDLHYYKHLKKNIKRLKSQIDDLFELSTGISYLENDLDKILEHLSEDTEKE